MWTFPLQSVSWIKYYVIFLISFHTLFHFLWVYPLLLKHYAFSKFLYFRAYVKLNFIVRYMFFNVIIVGNSTTLSSITFMTQMTFKFVSHSLTLSKKMTWVINNTICTQAHISSTCWVDALHMSIHILSIVPPTTLQNDSLYHKIFQKQPTYTHLCNTP